MQLLDRKPKATHLLGGLDGILSRVISHDVVRAVGRHLNAEQLHLGVFRKASDLDSFAMREFGFAPLPQITGSLQRDLIHSIGFGQLNFSIKYNLHKYIKRNNISEAMKRMIKIAFTSI